MTNTKKISLITALLININIIIGAGTFINIKPLTLIAGPFGFLGYLLSAILLFPFVYCIAKLAQAHPVPGGVYAYSKKYVGTLPAFISGWCYFIGKVVSAALLTSTFAKFLQLHFMGLQHLPPLLFTSIVITTLIVLNILGISIGGKIQFLFISIKSIPLLFTFIFGCSLFKPELFNLSLLPQLSIFSTIPIALYALMGFETTCAIGHMIENPQKNVFRTIVGSFIIAATIFTFFQAMIFGVLGQTLANHQEPLALLANSIFPAYPLIGNLISSLIFTSIIAGAFGILTSNCWNLHTLAQNNHLPGKQFLTKTTTAGVPWVSLVAEGTLAIVMLLITRNQIALTTMSVFGVVFSFLLSAYAAWSAVKTKHLNIAAWIPAMAIASCCYILSLCLQKLYITGVSFPYLLFLILGISMGIGKIFQKK